MGETEVYNRTVGLKCTQVIYRAKNNFITPDVKQTQKHLYTCAKSVKVKSIHTQWVNTGFAGYIWELGALKCS